MKAAAVLLLALAATALLIPAGLRHHLVWGGEYHQVLHVLEWLCVLLFTAGACVAMQQATRLVQAGRVDLRWIWKGAILLAILCLVAPPFLSDDVFSYVGRGRLMALHGGNPYVDKVSSFAEQDPELIAYMKGWADFPLPYGPLLAWLLAGIAWLAEQLTFLDFAARMWVAVYLYKAINLVVFLLGGVFVSRIASPRGTSAQGTALLLYLWNPFCLLEFGVNAHNDVFLTTPLLWALLEASRARHLRAGFGLLLSSLGKFTSLSLGPFFLALAWRQKALRPFVGAMVAGLLAYAVTWWCFWSGPEGLAWISQQGTIQGTSLQSLLQQLLGGSRDLWKTLGLAVFGLWLVLRLGSIRGFAALQVESAILLSILVVVALPVASPWYLFWWLPLAILADRRRAALALAWLLGPSYSIFLLTRTLDAPHQWLTWSLTLAVPTLLLWLSRRRADADIDSAGRADADIMARTTS